MSGTTSVPQPTLGPNGYVVPAESAVLAGVQADLNAAFGGNLNPGLSTPQGQIASSEAAIIGDSNAAFAYYVNQVDPAYASGRMQDAIGRIYFMTRMAAEPTIVQATCAGLQGVVIPYGAIAQATDGNLYLCQQTGTIPVSGSITLPFACTVTGPIACPATSLNVIYQTINGWDSITNAAPGVLGSVVESRAAFELRRQQSVAINANGANPAILAAILAVPGVVDAYVTDNSTSSPVSTGGQTIAANSVYCCVSGGASASVAQAIWSRKAPGCGYTGTTTVTVYDTQSGYNSPYPSYSVSFQIPTSITILISVVITNSATLPSNALTLIQAAIINAFAGADGGSRARIGSTLYGSRYYSAVAALGAWAQIIDIQLASTATTACAFTGSMAGTTTLTVTAISSGALAVGQFVSGVNILPCIITAQLTGSAGSTGTYSVSIAQTAASAAGGCYTPVNTTTMQINQAPVIAAADILLTLV